MRVRLPGWDLCDTALLHTTYHDGEAYDRDLDLSTVDHELSSTRLSVEIFYAHLNVSEKKLLRFRVLM